MAGKIDFKKALDAYRAPLREFRIVDVPNLQYLMVDGHGDPNTSPEFTHADTDARRVHPVQRTPDGRQASRDLPQRRAQGRARQGPHHTAAAGTHQGRREVIMRHEWSFGALRISHL
jgi:hypothetical protein